MRKLLLVPALLVAAADLWLVGTGRISGPVAVAALFTAELVLLGVFLGSSWLVARRREIPLTTLVPPLKLFVWEISAWRDLWFLLRGRVLVPADAVALPARRGMWQLPTMFSAAIVIEIVAVELLLPSLWLRLVFLVASLYSLPLMWGMVAARMIRPHYLTADELVLRRGTMVVARIPHPQITAVRRDRGFGAEQWDISAKVLTLGGQDGTNVLLTLAEPVPAGHDRWPWQPEHSSPVAIVRLWLDEPQDLVGPVLTGGD